MMVDNESRAKEVILSWFKGGKDFSLNSFGKNNFEKAWFYYTTHVEEFDIETFTAVFKRLMNDGAVTLE